MSLAVLALPAAAEVTTWTYALPRDGGAPRNVAVSADGLVVSRAK